MCARVKIPDSLKSDVEEYIKRDSNGFSSVDEFVTASVRDAVSKVDSKKNIELSEEEEIKVKDRLKKLGYL